jgi:nicotinamidase/pyrazinamidase
MAVTAKPPKTAMVSRRAAPQPGDGSALIVTDIQNDFCPGGALAVPDGDQIIPLVNACVRFFHTHGLPVIASRDWHPRSHCSFKEQGGPWPVHCVQGSWGAQFHPALVLPPDCTIISKATDPKREAYSSFEGTPLEERLKELGARTVFITGIATDYCVKNTVLDGLKRGFRTVVLKDGIRGIEATPGDSARALQTMEEAGAVVASTKDIGLNSET